MRKGHIMAFKASRNGTKVVTGKVRTSFPRLFVPAAPPNDPDGDKKYSVLLLIPKDDKATIKAIREAQKQALEDGKAKFAGKVPKNWSDSLHDCDEEDDLEQYPEREGHYRISVSATENYPPAVVDKHLQPIMDQTEVYSGCYVRVSMVGFAYSVQGNKGVSFGLRNVQKLADGEPLGGSSKPEDDFDMLDDDEDEDIL